MAWEWLEESFGLGAESEPAAKPVEPPRQAPKIESCWVVVAQPRHEGDRGSTVPCHYYVEDGTLVLCDELGKPAGVERRLAKGDQARATAMRLARQAWDRDNERSAFNSRVLRYGPSGVA
jgi:hypothetical protein